MIMIKAIEMRKFLCLECSFIRLLFIFFLFFKMRTLSDKRYWHSFFFVQIFFQNKLFITMICNNSSCLFLQFYTIFATTNITSENKVFLVELSPLLSSKDNKEMNKKHMFTLGNRHFCDSVLFLCF